MKYVKHDSAEYPVPLGYQRRRPHRILAMTGGKIRHLVENDDLMEAVELLLELMDFCCPEKLNDASLLKRRISAMDKKVRVGVLEDENVWSERNRVALAIMEMAECA